MGFNIKYSGVIKSVDMQDFDSCAFLRVGSSPTLSIPIFLDKVLYQKIVDFDIKIQLEKLKNF